MITDIDLPLESQLRGPCGASRLLKVRLLPTDSGEASYGPAPGSPQGPKMLQFRKRRENLATLRRIFEREDSVLVIHYSCESFADKTGSRSPRVTSIAVRNLKSGHTDSFSVQQVAERRGVVDSSVIAQEYDSMEREMLQEFYTFVVSHQNFDWVHWCMRDTHFGFPALAHRYRVLGGNPVEIATERLVDISRVLVAIYGGGYIAQPRMETLFKFNNISMQSFLPGAEEGAAFEAKEYLRLHRSTLRKVDNIANVLERASKGTLKTNSKLRERYGISFRELFLAAREHPVWVGLALLIAAFTAFADLTGRNLKDCNSAPTPSATEFSSDDSD